MVSFSGLVGKAITAAVTSGASTLAKVGAASAGQALFGSSPGRSVGVSAATSGANITQILEDDDLDFQKTSLGAAGFVKGIPDYRRVGATDATAQARSIADSGLERVIASMMSTPPITPDVGATLIGSMASPRSVVSNSASKKFKKYIKGLT